MNEKKGSKNEEAVYTGEWLKETKTRQGKGVLERQNGERYEGYFFNNKFNGRGMLYFAEDDKEGRKLYTGNFTDDHFDGRGIM